MIRERKLLRLKGYEYSQPGAYFITICTQNRECFFGNIDNGKMVLNECGKIVEQQWCWLFDQYDYLKMGEYCIMPNHFHGIIWICPDDVGCDHGIVVGNGHGGAVGNGCGGVVGNGRDRSLQKIKPIPELIGAFKTTSSKLIHLNVPQSFKWQKSFYDVIIRDDESYHRIVEYIKNNPGNWEKDNYYRK